MGIDATHQRHDTAMARTIGPGLLLVFVVGNLLGAGVYAIVGEVAREVGGALWMPFVVAGVLAGITAFAYVELITKYPQAGGAALYVSHAFDRPLATVVVAVGVAAAAVTSAATSARAFADQYLGVFVELPVVPVAIAFLVVLSIVNWWGIDESLSANAVLTAIVVGGLLLVAGVGLTTWLSGDAQTSGLTEIDPPSGGSAALALVGGTALAFFSFVGFEDTAQVAEETEEPNRAFPIALFGGLAITLVIYLAVGVAASIVLPAGELSEAAAPLVAVVEAGSSIPGEVVSAVALVALTNTALLQLVAASRLLYGTARRDLLPPQLERVGDARGTPTTAVVVAGALAVVLAASGDLAALADTTVMLLLTVFAAVNVAALRLRSEEVDHPHVTAPWPMPVLGAVLSLALTAYTAVDNGWGVTLRYLGLLGVGVAVYGAQRLLSERTRVLDADEYDL